MQHRVCEFQRILLTIFFNIFGATVQSSARELYGKLFDIFHIVAARFYFVVSFVRLCFRTKVPVQKRNRLYRQTRKTLDRRLLSNPNLVFSRDDHFRFRIGDGFARAQLRFSFRKQHRAFRRFNATRSCRAAYRRSVVVLFQHQII